MPPALKDKHVVVIGGSSGIGLATAHLARRAGARLTLAARDSERLGQARQALGGDVRTARLDVSQESAVSEFFEQVGGLDHALLSAGEAFYAPIGELDPGAARRYLDQRLWPALWVAKHAASRMPTRGSLTLLSGSQLRRPAVGLAVIGMLGRSTVALAENLALELAPIRVNVVAPGFVDTPLSARILGDRLEARRRELRETLPIRRVVGPDEVGALIVHLMENDAITGAVIPVDGGQALL